MKRCLITILMFAGVRFSLAQCTYSCSSYVVSPITFSMYPAAGHTLSMLDDEVSTTLPLHFNFEFYCTLYNQVRICSNGFITFDFSNIPFAGTPYAQSLPDGNVPDAVVAWNWNDLDPSVGGTITYTTIGATPNQKFIVTYSAVPLWTPANPPGNLLNTGQIVLHETTNIIEVHVARAVNNGWLTHTEGIENAGATAAMVVPGRNLSLWSTTNSSHMFSPFVISPSPQISGDTLLCEGTTAHFTSTAVLNALGYHWSYPSGWAGSGTGVTHSATAGASGNVSVAAIYTCGNSPPATLQVSVLPAPTVSASAAPTGVFCSGTAFSVVPYGASSYTIKPPDLTSSTFFTVFPADTMVFTIVGGDSSGCISLNTATVMALVKPSPTIAVNSGSVCAGNTFTMQPTGSDNYTYSSVFNVVTPTVSGIFQFSVTSTGTNQCVSRPAVSSVTVAPPPEVMITADRNYVCAHESVTLTASGASTYTWQSPAVTGSTLTVSPPLNMNFKVNATDLIGCTASAEYLLITSSCVGLNETEAGRWKVYPNPVEANHVNVFAYMNTDYILFNYCGNTVEEGHLLPGRNQVDLNNLKNGVYFLRDSRGGQTLKIVISRP